jgi:Domain of unknown function (DUF222)
VRARAALAELPDDQLIGTLPVLRSITAQATARELAVTQELLRRRKPGKWSSGTEQATGITREAVEEVALALTLTRYSAQAQTQLAKDLRDKLPATFTQMTTGKLDPARVRVIAEATSLMDPDVARKIDREIAGQAPAMTTGKLRDELRKREITTDPKSADKRRERAESRASVRLYPDSDFTAAWKSAGATGPTGLLRAKVFLGLLLGTLEIIAPPDGGAGPAGPGRGPEPDVGGPGSDQRAPWPTAPGTAAAAAPGCAALPAGLNINPGRLTLTAAFRTLAGTGSEPGQLTRIGPVTPAQAQRLAAAAAADPTVSWTVLLTDDDGHAIGVAALRKTTTSTAPGMIGEVIIAISAKVAGQYLRGELENVVKNPKLDQVARAAARAPARNGECDHSMQVPGYRIPPTTRRWVAIRDRTCFSPICRMPASQPDSPTPRRRIPIRSEHGVWNAGRYADIADVQRLASGPDGFQQRSCLGAGER